MTVADAGDVLATIATHRIVPVCTVSSAHEAEALGHALVAGGIPIAEVTLRAPDSMDAVREMVRIEGLLVGVGTVRCPEQFRAAEAGGADFVVSPCLTPSLVEAGRASKTLYIPAVATPTEIQYASEAGFSTLKFFHAESYGGAKALRGFSEVFGEISFMPSGGVSAATVSDYLALSAVVAASGSWMLPRPAREGGDWEALTRAISICAAAVVS